MLTTELKDVLLQLISGSIDTNPGIVHLLPGKEDPLPVAGNSGPDVGTSFDEDQLIDLLLFTDERFILPKICADLATSGTVFALPALISKLDFKDRNVVIAANAAIQMIKTREGLPNRAVNVLKDPAFHKAKWNKTALHFLAFYSVFCNCLGFEVESVESDLVADMLVNELSIDLGSFASFKELRICHVETDQYYTAIRQFGEKLIVEQLVNSELHTCGITESRDTDLHDYYCQLINEFLNIKLIGLFKTLGLR